MAAHGHPAGEAFPVLFGKNGLAWGSGLAGQDENGLQKKEKDGRAPAGIFRIGKIYTYDAQLPPGSDYPFHQVTTADAWVDDVTSPNYNRFVTIDDPANPPPGFRNRKMRHNDFAYRWLVEIRHNSDPPVPGTRQRHFFPHPARREQTDSGMHDDGGTRIWCDSLVGCALGAIHALHYCQMKFMDKSGGNGICPHRKMWDCPNKKEKSGCAIP